MSSIEEQAIEDLEWLSGLITRAHRERSARDGWRIGVADEESGRRRASIIALARHYAEHSDAVERFDRLRQRIEVSIKWDMGRRVDDVRIVHRWPYSRDVECSDGGSVHVSVRPDDVRKVVVQSDDASRSGDPVSVEPERAQAIMNALMEARDVAEKGASSMYAWTENGRRVEP